MGLLDFLFKKDCKQERVSTVTKTVGNFTISSTASVTTEWVDSDIEFIEPPDTLRELKTYSENVEQPCGFDFSAVRRYRSAKGTWWLEGGNYDRAIAILSDLEKFEDEVRGKGFEFPHACSYIATESKPYSRGEDGNIVPTISTSDTKADGPCIDVNFRICKSNKLPLAIASARISPDGKIMSGKVTYFEMQGAAGWSLSVAYRKRSGKLVLTKASHDYIDLLDEKKRKHQLEERNRSERQLMEVGTVEKITDFARGSLNLADELGMPTGGARKALTARGWDTEFERTRNEMRMTRKDKSGSGLIIVNSDGKFGRLRYWAERGAPEIEYHISPDGLSLAKVRGEYLNSE